MRQPRQVMARIMAGGKVCPLAKCVHIGLKIIMKCLILGQFMIQLERTFP